MDQGNIHQDEYRDVTAPELWTWPLTTKQNNTAHFLIENFEHTEAMFSQCHCYCQEEIKVVTFSSLY